MKEKKFWKITPHLPVPDVKQTIEWYIEKLGFSESWYYDEPATDGGCRRDEMRLIFGKSNNFSIPPDFSLILFVDNIEDIFLEVKEKGLEIISQLTPYDYGIKEFSIRDINGYLLRFAESI